VAGCEVTIEGRLTHLRLDGTRHNALGGARYERIREVASQLGQDDVLLLSAEGPDFSAGQDLDELEHARANGRLGVVLRQGTEAILALLESRATLVAAVQGAAIGGGALVAAAADVLLLGSSARFRLPELSMGMPLGAAVADRMVGPRAARRMMLTGDWLSADEVVALGGGRLCADDRLLPEAMESCSALLRTSAEARSAARFLFGNGERAAVARAYRDEVKTTLTLLSRDAP
jgi:enoyl-CoA hydratase/carnithine racemase